MKTTTLFILLYLLCLPYTLLAITPDESISRIKQLYYRDRLQSESLELKEQIAIVDTLIQYAYQDHNSKELIPLYIQKATLEYQNNTYTAAYPIYDSAISNINRFDLTDQYKHELPELYIQQGKISYFLGKYATGISYMYELLRLKKLSPQIQIQAYTQLGNFYIRLQKNNLALKNLKEAQTTLQKTHPNDSIHKALEFDIYIAFSSAYLQKEDYDTSVAYIEKARKVSSKSNLTKLYQNLSILHLVVNEPEMALEYCRKAFETAQTPYDRSVILNNYAIMCYNQKKYDLALDLCKKNLIEIEKIDAAHVKSNLYSIFSRIYADQNNYKEALAYRQKEQEVLDSIFDKESEEQVMQLSNEFETEKIKRDKTLLEYKLKLTELGNFRKNTLIALLIILSISILLAVSAIVQKIRKQKKSLQQQLIHLDEDKNKIIQSSKEEFETAINHKSRELTANTMYMAKMCDVASQILNEINLLEPYCREKEAKNILQTIQREISSLTSEERGWDDFRLHFEQIHPSFFTRLNEAHPHLTLGESKMCAFIVMNLNTKEIASLTNRSIRTVDTTKFRIRKKMDIPKEATTLSYLRQFLSENSLSNFPEVFSDHTEE